MKSSHERGCDEDQKLDLSGLWQANTETVEKLATIDVDKIWARSRSMKARIGDRGPFSEIKSPL